MADDGDIIGIGSIVSCKTCFEEEVTGEVVAFDRETRFLVLKQAVAGRPPSCCNITFLNMKNVKDFNIVKEVTTPTENTLQKIDMKMLTQRRERELEKKRRLIDAIRANVTEEGRDLFTHISKTLDEVKWSGANIVVMNDVTIAAPYGTDCVTSKSDNAQRIQYISKIVEKFIRDRGSEAAGGE